eukprot:GHVN01090016.1.p2 GENE.GHVN01090016.1~~GHVN01090016.1.p2  ORF type:complete len:305 (-),score=28.69 GHVN01090016.1:3091-4005(-)
MRLFLLFFLLLSKDGRCGFHSAHFLGGMKAGFVAHSYQPNFLSSQAKTGQRRFAAPASVKRLTNDEILIAADKYLTIGLDGIEMPPKLKVLIRAFQLITDPNLSLQAMMEFGHKLGSFDPKHKTEENMSKACLSRAWIVAIPYLHEGVLRFKVQGKGEADVVTGFVNVLCEGLSGASADSFGRLTTDLGSRAGFSAGYKENRALGFSDLLAIVKSQVHLIRREKEYEKVSHSSPIQDGYANWHIHECLSNKLPACIERHRILAGDFVSDEYVEDAAFTPMEGAEEVLLFNEKNLDDDWMDEDDE